MAGSRRSPVGFYRPAGRLSLPVPGSAGRLECRRVFPAKAGQVVTLVAAVVTE